MLLPLDNETLFSGTESKMEPLPVVAMPWVFWSEMGPPNNELLPTTLEGYDEIEDSSPKTETTPTGVALPTIEDAELGTGECGEEEGKLKLVEAAEALFTSLSKE